MNVLRERWNIDNGNVFVISSLIDMKGLKQILRLPQLSGAKAPEAARAGAAAEPARGRRGQHV
ncbi:MAG: hypothetical protein WKG07_13695 [Hymenobacter sp.]